MTRRSVAAIGLVRPHRARKRFGQHFLAPAWALKVVNAIAPAPGDVFLEIGPGRGSLGKHAGMGADPHQKLVLALPIQCVREVEGGGAEASQVLADLPPVQPHRRPELGLVDFENGDLFFRGHLECSPVPKVIPRLPRDPD